MSIELAAEELARARRLRSDFDAARSAYGAGNSIVERIDAMAPAAQSLHDDLAARGAEPKPSRQMFANRKDAAKPGEAFYQNLHALEDLLNLLGV